VVKVILYPVSLSCSPLYLLILCKDYSLCKLRRSIDAPFMFWTPLPIFLPYLHLHHSSKSTKYIQFNYSSHTPRISSPTLFLILFLIPPRDHTTPSPSLLFHSHTHSYNLYSTQSYTSLPHNNSHNSKLELQPTQHISPYIFLHHNTTHHQHILPPTPRALSSTISHTQPLPIHISLSFYSLPYLTPSHKSTSLSIYHHSHPTINFSLFVFSSTNISICHHCHKYNTNLPHHLYHIQVFPKIKKSNLPTH
jgi:hypothetical protein